MLKKNFRDACVLSVLAAAGAANAQSSVSISGVLDLAARYNKNGDVSMKSLSYDGNSSSRLSFQGDEDLGSGAHAAFWLEAGVNPDTGTTNATFWNRRSLLRVYHDNYGELRLGRDYVPTHWNPTLFDPFVANGVGALYNLVSLLGSSGVFVSANNSVQYFLPTNFGGLYGMAMVSAPEGGSGKYEGFRIGYRKDAYNVAFQTGVSTNLTGGKYKTANLGASYDFGVVKLFVDLDDRKYDPAEQKLWSVGAYVPIGVGGIRGSFTKTKITGGTLDGNGAEQAAIGYVYNLSKRTAWYTTYSHISNSGPGLAGKALFNTNGTQIVASPLAGQASQGFEIGLRHNF
jgi:predicted porin